MAPSAALLSPEPRTTIALLSRDGEKAGARGAPPGASHPVLLRRAAATQPRRPKSHRACHDSRLRPADGDLPHRIRPPRPRRRRPRAFHASPRPPRARSRRPRPPPRPPCLGPISEKEDTRTRLNRNYATYAG